MHKDSEERERRISQFEKVLRLTSSLRSDDDWGDAYVVLDELRPCTSSLRQKKRTVSACRESSLAAAVGVGAETLRGPVEWDEPKDEPEDGSPRFVQLWFAKDWFFVEMPTTTLASDEADRLRHMRTGFRFIGKAAPLHYIESTLRTFNPFVKVFLHGDERLAGEDLAAIWFDLWSFPLETSLLATVRAKSKRPPPDHHVLLM